jgi:hypothetical protein
MDDGPDKTDYLRMWGKTAGMYEFIHHARIAIQFAEKPHTTLYNLQSEYLGQTRHACEFNFDEQKWVGEPGVPNTHRPYRD